MLYCATECCATRGIDMDASPLIGTVVRLKNSWCDPPWSDYGIVFEVLQLENRKTCVIVRVDGGRTLCSESSVEACPLERQEEVEQAVLVHLESKVRQSHEQLERLQKLLSVTI
jgi:hypothetical protein